MATLAQISPQEGSIEPNGNTGLSLPPALEERLKKIEARIADLATCCPLAHLQPSPPTSFFDVGDV